MPSPRSTPCNAKPSSRRAKRISEIGKRISARSSKTRTADMALDQIYNMLEGQITGALAGRYAAVQGLVEAPLHTAMAINLVVVGYAIMRGVIWAERRVGKESVGTCR